jgi:hypothetical protein
MVYDHHALDLKWTKQFLARLSEGFGTDLAVQYIDIDIPGEQQADQVLFVPGARSV